MDKNKHLFFMRKLLREFYSDDLLSSQLCFKGGTAAMLFEGLPRFSTDLDFNIVDKSKQKEVFDRIQAIASGSGIIADSANKRFGPVVVLDYGAGDRNLKIEVSNRIYDCHYVLRDFGPIVLPVMIRSDMLTHKLCAMHRRKAPRDIFDVWYFLSKGWPLNENIIKERIGIPVDAFLKDCLNSVNSCDSAAIMMEIGELLDDSMKPFVRNGGLTKSCCGLIEDYIASPLLEDVEPTEHTKLLFQNAQLLPALQKYKLDPSVISVSKLKDILSGNPVLLHKISGEGVIVRIDGKRVIVGNGRGLE